MPRTKKTPSPADKKPVKAKPQPTQDQIAERAYQIYLERNGAPGDPMQDWIRAEQELREQPKKPRRKNKVVSIAA